MLGVWYFFFQAEDGIRDLVRSRGLGDVYKRQDLDEALGGVGDDERRGAAARDGHHEVAAIGVQVWGALVHGVEEPAEVAERVDAQVGLRAVRRASLEVDAGDAEAAQGAARGKVGRLTDEADVRLNVEGGELSLIHI